MIIHDPHKCPACGKVNEFEPDITYWGQEVPAPCGCGVVRYYPLTKKPDNFT